MNACKNKTVQLTIDSLKCILTYYFSQKICLSNVLYNLTDLIFSSARLGITVQLNKGSNYSIHWELNYTIRPM